MKLRLLSAARLSFPLATALTAMLGANLAIATPYYWDTDNATAGAGGAAPAGTWSTGGTTWSTSPNGTVATPGYTTTAADDLFFSAGVGATGTYGISLTSTENASSLMFQEGTATVSGASGVVNLGGTGGKITVNNGATATIGANTNTTIGGSVGLTKLGVGTLTLNGTLANTFTGGLNVNGGTLALDFANLGTPTDLINSGNALTLGGGSLTIAGKAASTNAQTFNGVTLASGGGRILSTNNTATNIHNITLGALTTTASGSGLLVGTSNTAGTAGLTITTTSNVDATGIYGGRVVFANGTASTGFDWATNTGGGGPSYTLSTYAGYAALSLGAGTDTANSRITANATMTGSRTTNSLKFENPATAQTLTIGALDTLTLSNGGLLFTGAALAQGPRISGGTITAGNGSGSYDLVVHAYNATNLSVAANNTGSATNNTAINSIIANNGANAVTLVKNGPGALHLGGANTFTGGIIVNQGDLQAGVATALNNNAITFNATANFTTTGATTSNGVITLNNNAQVTFVNNNNIFTTSGQVTGTGGISIERGGLGSNTVNLNATTNDFTGPIRFVHRQANQNANLTVNSLADTTTIGEGNITFGATALNVNGTSISHNFSLGTSAVAVTLNNRQFELATLQPIQSINNNGAQAFNINTNLLVSSTTGKVLTLGGTGAGLSTFSGIIANNAAPTTGSTIQAAQKAASATTLTLASVEGIQVGDAISGTSITAGTTVTAVNQFTKVVTLSVASAAATQNAGITITTPNVVNSVSIRKDGSGTWVLSGNNSYTGTTNITAGALNIQNINALGATGATSGGTLVANGATLQLQGGFSYAAEPLTLTPGGSGTAMLLNVSGNNTWNGPITSNTATVANVSRLESVSGTMTVAGSVNFTGSAHQLVLQGNGDITVSGQITGIGRLTSGASGTGIRTINNDTNNFTGATSVNGSTLAFTTVGNVGATSSSLGAPVLADATIGIGAASVNGTLRHIGLTQSTDRTVRIGVNSGTPAATDTGGATIEANGVSNAPLTFSAATFNVQTNASAGVGADRTLTLAGSSTGANTISGVIQDNLVSGTGTGTATVGLTKSGLGNWILTGASTYTGVTTVNGGRLAVNGSTASGSAVTVNTGGTLGGNGTIGGSVTVNSGGILDPGNSIDSLATGALTLNGGGTYDYEADNNASASTAGDLTAVTGNLTLDSITPAVLTLTELGAGSWSNGDKLTLISYSGSWNGETFNYSAAPLLDDSNITFSGTSWQFNYNDTSAGTNYTGELTGTTFVTITAIPEARTALLAGLGLLAFLRRRK